MWSAGPIDIIDADDPKDKEATNVLLAMQPNEPSQDGPCF
jgi:hypothetical protein